MPARRRASSRPSMKGVGGSPRATSFAEV